MKKNAIKKLSEILGIIVTSSIIVMGAGTLCYKAYGKEVIQTEIKLYHKNYEEKIEKRISMVEKNNTTIKKDLKKLIKDGEFRRDVLYHMDKQAYLKTKKEWNDKGKW